MDGRRKRRNRTESLIGIIFLLLLFFIMILNFVVPDRESVRGGEPDAGDASSLTLSSAVSGDFMEQ